MVMHGFGESDYQAKQFLLGRGAHWKYCYHDYPKRIATTEDLKHVMLQFPIRGWKLGKREGCEI